MKGIDELTNLYRKILNGLSEGKLEEVGREMTLMKDSDDIGELKVVLILTKSFKDHPTLKAIRAELRDKYEYLYQKLKTTPND